MSAEDATAGNERRFALDLPRSLILRRGRPSAPLPGQPDVEERVVRMRQFEIFSTLPSHLLQSLADSARIHTHRAGEILWQQDEPTTQVLFIERGLVKSSRRIRPGMTRTYGLYGPGDSMGIYAIWAGMKYPTDAIALNDGMTAIALPPEALVECARRQPHLSATLMAEIGRFTEAFIHKIEVVSAGTVPQRIATLLALLVTRYGSETADGRAELPIYLTLEHIGEIVDARIETVARALGEWKRQGWVNLDSDGFHFAHYDRVRALLPESAPA